VTFGFLDGFAEAWDPARPIPVFPMDRDVRPNLHWMGTLIVPKRLADGSLMQVDVWVSKDPGFPSQGPVFETAFITPYNPDPNVAQDPPTQYFGEASYAVLSQNVPDDGPGCCGRVRLRDGRTLQRVHTSFGVSAQGFGFGFVLYAAAALGVAFFGMHGVSSPQKQRDSDHEEPGGERTPDADKAWHYLRTLGFMGGKPLAQEAWLDYLVVQEDQSWHEAEHLSWPTDYITIERVLESGIVTRKAKGLLRYGKHVPPPENVLKLLNTNLTYKTR